MEFFKVHIKGGHLLKNAHAYMPIFQLMTPLDMYLKKLRKIFPNFPKRNKIKTPNFHLRGDLSRTKSQVGWFYFEKRWGTNKTKSVSICHGHLLVSGLRSIPIFNYYSTPLLLQTTMRIISSTKNTMHIFLESPFR